MGAKMFHFGLKKSAHIAPYVGFSADYYFKTLPNNAHLLLAVGEIDSRPDEGIWNAYKSGKDNLDTLVNQTVDRYIDAVTAYVRPLTLKSITVQGVPAPNYALKRVLLETEQSVFLDMIRSVNDRLRAKALENGWWFLDVYSATVNDAGVSNKKYHIDSHHLNPVFYQDAEQYLIKA